MLSVTPFLLLLIGLVGLALTYNAFRPRYAPANVAMFSFFSGWLVAELALHQIVFQGLVVATLVWGGGLAAWPGKLGLALSLLSWFFLWISWRGGDASSAVIATALSEALGDDYEDLLVPARVGAPVAHPEWRQLVFPIPVTHPQVERTRDLVYHDDGKLRLKLDIYRERGVAVDRNARQPVLLFVHGGGWCIGSKEHQGLPLLQRFAARGWVCVTINYRLSPRATFPDHVVDVKRAIAWVREHAAEYGGDPDFIVVSGGSAGGHLASLAALTAGHEEFQPGFPRADTSVAACVSLYGIYDFTDRHGHWPNPGLEQLLARHVLKVKRKDHEAAFAAASPITYLDDQAPPFLLVHGDRDSLVPVAEGRSFYAALREVSNAPCAYFEIPGAQHAFEVFPSPRTLHVLRGIEQFLDFVHTRYREKARAA
jgi:acetyl esterase/lipase